VEDKIVHYIYINISFCCLFISDILLMICRNNCIYIMRSILVDMYRGLDCQYELDLWLPRFSSIDT
jgi:hypothetical protein